MIRSLKEEADAIDQSEQLVHGMQELKRMNLLLRKNLQKIQFPGVGKYTHIHNDYHQRITNPGYSRNFFGKFYMKWMIPSIFFINLIQSSIRTNFLNHCTCPHFDIIGHFFISEIRVGAT